MLDSFDLQGVASYMKEGSSAPSIIDKRAPHGPALAPPDDDVGASSSAGMALLSALTAAALWEAFTPRELPSLGLEGRVLVARQHSLSSMDLLVVMVVVVVVVVVMMMRRRIVMRMMRMRGGG